MTKYRIRYTRIPTNDHDTQSALVEAETPETAIDVLAYQLGDDQNLHHNRYGFHYSGSLYVYGEPEVYNPPPGRVVAFSGGEE